MNNIEQKVINTLNTFKQKGQLNDVLGQDYNNHPKWIMLICMLISKGYPDGGFGIRREAEEIYKKYVLPWKEQNKIQTESKNMNKKLIRLTESDLHRIVKESVNKILTELDWKTYASASDKARQRGTSYWRDKGETDLHNLLTKATSSQHRADRFADAARDAFNRDFGYQRGKPYDDDYERVAMGGDFRSSEEFGPHAVGYKSKGWGNPKKYEFGRDDDVIKSMSPEEFYQDDADAAQAFRNADSEVKNYRRGNYDYQKGKGWQLKH